MFYHLLVEFICDFFRTDVLPHVIVIIGLKAKPLDKKIIIIQVLEFN